jgi:hypothetical protein
VHGSPLCKRALAIWEKALGMGHPHTKPVKRQFGTASKPDFPERFRRAQPHRQGCGSKLPYGCLENSPPEALGAREGS